MTLADQLRVLVLENPRITTSEAAAAMGVTRASAYRVSRGAGLKLRVPPPVGYPIHRRPSGAKPQPQSWLGGPPLSTGILGDAAEHVVAAALLLRGFVVYKAVTHNSPADMIAQPKGGGPLYRVEVRTAHRTSLGSALQCARNNPSNYDILAMVSRDGEIQFHPPLEGLDKVSWPRRAARA